uniref:Single domain-containing protein n=1 Tax=Clastoptera arizonana TaxID=38151 RepID=A0A1B6E3N3_9HEMI
MVMEFKMILVFIGCLCILQVMAEEEFSGCVHNGVVYSVGESFTPAGTCTLYTCVETNSIYGKACPLFQAPGCEIIGEDLTKSYPECCPKPKCPKKFSQYKN